MKIARKETGRWVILTSEVEAPVRAKLIQPLIRAQATAPKRMPRAVMGRDGAESDVCSALDTGFLCAVTRKASRVCLD
ncbi:MAG: hypothetical protein CME21_13875 [Gemmatimonadetes bacterium]|nr:hypothetical protein [Gemmatimonadota bacterium]